MTAAALSLALAVLVAPGAPVRRLRPVTGSGPPVRWWLPGALVGAAGIVAGLALLPMPATLAAGLVAGCWALRRRRRTAMRRRAVEAAALQEALDALIGELRVGAHPVSAVEVAAREVSGTTGLALREVAARARLGGEVSSGLRSVAARSASPGNWERLAVCWRLAERYGLAVATLMRTAQHDIRERERFSAKVHADLAGARTTATLLAALPVLGIGLGQAIGAEPVRFLCTDGIGVWLLVTGAALLCCGQLWSDRIIEGVVK